MSNQGWKCPNCGKAHGPHVNTCPGISGMYPSTAPLYPNTAPVYPNTTPVDEIKPKCPKCGIELSPVMGYVCGVNGCPTGLGPNIGMLNG